MFNRKALKQNKSSRKGPSLKKGKKTKKYIKNYDLERRSYSVKNLFCDVKRYVILYVKGQRLQKIKENKRKRERKKTSKEKK